MKDAMHSEAQVFPAVAKALGYGGVIPFLLLAVCVAVGIDLAAFGVTEASWKLAGYAAVIISFIGAVHWGVAMQSSLARRRNLLFIYSVVPALLAWAWLFFDIKTALVGLGVTIVVMLFIDRWLLSDLVSPAYLKMRMHLTVVVSLCLFLAAFFVEAT